MLSKISAAIAGAIALSTTLFDIAAAQTMPPTIQLGGIEYAIEFQSGIFGDNLVELQAQPWYATNDFTLAAAAARQVYDCGAGSPFNQPTCATPFSAFDSISTGFGGLSPWFVYDVEAGVAAAAVGFSEVTGGDNVLRLVNTNLSAEQPFAIATSVSMPDQPDRESIPEPVSVVTLSLLGIALASSRWRQQQR